MMTITSTRCIVDTCLLLFWSQPDETVAPVARQAIEAADDGIYVSAISAWEIGMLVSKGRLNLTRNPLEWFRAFVDEREIRVLDVTPEILVSASFLPQPLHNDPADRILIATAREHDLTIITRDRAILAYGAAGHVRTLAC
jgi:PIN domain nuclease of toxin-antitoxin system